LELLNADILPHSFDVDELNLHLAMPARDTAETTLTITHPAHTPSTAPSPATGKQAWLVP
jgi:hypothetical protein